MRPALALLAGAATAAFGAVVLGEYQLNGVTGVVAGALFGLAVAEVVLSVGGARLSSLLTVAAVAVGLLSAAGLIWSAWISAGHDWGYVPNGGWMGVVAGAVVSPWWLRSGVHRAARPPVEPS